MGKNNPKQTPPPKPRQESNIVNLGENSPKPIVPAQPPKPSQPSHVVTKTFKPKK